jgi:hypothetical protein
MNDMCLAYTAKREVSMATLRDTRAVVEVVEHRMRKNNKSCKAVVSEPNQFSWWHKNVKMKVDRKELTRFKSSRKLRPVLPRCADHFYSESIKPPAWTRKMKRVGKIGKTVYFCSHK